MLYCMVMRKDLSEKDTCRERGGLSGWPQSYKEGFQSEGAGKVKTHFFSVPWQVHHHLAEMERVSFIPRSAYEVDAPQNQNTANY